MHMPKPGLLIVVLESFAHRRLVLVTDDPPICEALLWHAGCAVSYQNIAQHLEAIVGTVSKPERSSSLGRKGQHEIRAICAPKRAVDTDQRMSGCAVGR